jgi:hypothetical protein
VVASAAGVVGVVLMAVGVMLGDTSDQPTNPNPTQSGEALAEALVANRDDARLGAYLVLVAAFVLLVFAARLAGYLRQRALREEWMSSVVLVAGGVLVAVAVVEAGFAFAVSELEAYGADTAVARALFVWTWNSAFLFAPSLTAMAAGTTVAAFTQGLFPTWARWAGAVLVALMLLVFFSGVPGMATGLGLLWLMLASVALTLSVLRRSPGSVTSGGA